METHQKAIEGIRHPWTWLPILMADSCLPRRLLARSAALLMGEGRLPDADRIECERLAEGKNSSPHFGYGASYRGQGGPAAADCVAQYACKRPLPAYRARRTEVRSPFATGSCRRRPDDDQPFSRRSSVLPTTLGFPCVQVPVTRRRAIRQPSVVRVSRSSYLPPMRNWSPPSVFARTCWARK